ncbi:MAG: hypothetical protein HQ542_11605 [Bacteroidia bacterium]|nr:hypothetical protein [Bacteroidia bacterium]
MKNKIYLFLFGVLLWTFPVTMFGQQEELKTLLEGKETFQEITETVDQFLETMPEGVEKEKLTKHYNRWAYYRSLHLGPNGEMVNISKKTWEALDNQGDAPLTTPNGDWTFVGPSSSTINNPYLYADINGIGRIDRIAFHPTNSSIIYIGATSGGLWKTTDGGSSWTPISNFIPSLGISGIVLDHTDPNKTIWVLTGDGDSFVDGYFVNNSGYIRLSVGVLVTHDGGTTWEQTGTISTGDFAGYRLIQHPTNADILIAATSDGIYRTTDGGDTWVQERAGKHFDVEFKPGDPSRVYASGPGSFVYSTNTGDTWNTNATFSHSLCSGYRVELAVTPDYPNKVYLFAARGYSGSNTFCGFYASTDSGSSFTRLCNSPNVLGKEDGSGNDQSTYDMCITAHPTDDQKIVVGGLVTYKSTNGGSTFTAASTYRESGGNYIHPDIHDVAYSPVNGYLYAVGDGGFHRSTNNGASWTDLYNGIETTQFYHMTDYDANQYAMLAGCQDNGVKYKTANSSNFSHIFCCDGADGVIQYNDQTKGFAAINNAIYKYTNFTTTSPTLVLTGGFFMQVEMNTGNTNIIYVSSNYVYSYVVSTSTLTQLGSTAHGHWALKTCPSNTSKIYAAGGTSAFATTGEMYMSSDGGTSWSTVSNNTGFPGTFPRISDIGVKPNYSPQVYACFSGYTDGVKVVYSSNSGTSWTNVSYDLPNVPVWSIEVDASNNVYIGCDIGVYYKASGATNWEPFYNFLPNVPVSDLAINEGADQLLASTFGRGIWKSSLRAPCAADASITANVSGPYFKSASNSITMTSQLTGGEGTSAVLRAGEYVDLKPGFKADGDPGTKFLAYIGPCDSGIPPDAASGVLTDTVSDQYPFYPQELDEYDFMMTRHLGTLEVAGAGGMKEVIIRLSGDGKVRVLLADGAGNFIRDIANFTGTENTYTYPVETSNLTPGLYYLYLVIDNKVIHLQELETEITD